MAIPLDTKPKKTEEVGEPDERGIIRNRHGWPMIRPEGGGKRKAFRRTSKVSEFLKDSYILTRWESRLVALGVTSTPSLANQIRGLHVDNDRDRLNDLCEQAKTAAGGDLAANFGTDVHACLEGQMRPHWGKEVYLCAQAVRVAMQQAGLQFVPNSAETFVGNSILGAAGSCDGAVTDGTTSWMCDFKGLALDTLIPTPTGWATVASIRIGDVVFAADGRRCNVIGKSGLRLRDCFRLTFDNGVTVVADDEHKWPVRFRGSGPVDVLTTQEMFDRYQVCDRGARFSVAHAKPIDCEPVELTTDPYVLGAWLGDGSTGFGSITKPYDHPIWGVLESKGFSLTAEREMPDGRCPTRTLKGLVHQLRADGVLDKKHIPAHLLRGSFDQRLALFRGLMDTDGTYNYVRRRAAWGSVDKEMALDMMELCLSLGYRPQFNKIVGPGYGKMVTSYRVEFTPTGLNPFFARAGIVPEADMAPRKWVPTGWAISKIEQVESEPTQCLAVDSPDHTFLCTESFIATHNTSSLKDGDDKDKNKVVCAPSFKVLDWMIQLASYRFSDFSYDWVNDCRIPLPQWLVDCHPTRAKVFFIDSKTYECRIIDIDLEAGWQGAQLTLAIDQWQKTKVRDVALVTGYVPPFADNTPQQRIDLENSSEAAGATPVHVDPPSKQGIEEDDLFVVRSAPGTETPDDLPAGLTHVADLSARIKKLPALQKDLVSTSLIAAGLPGLRAAARGEEVMTCAQLALAKSLVADAEAFVSWEDTKATVAEIVQPPAAEPVVDLMDALQKSLEIAKEKKAEQELEDERRRGFGAYGKDFRGLSLVPAPEATTPIPEPEPFEFIAVETEAPAIEVFEPKEEPKGIIETEMPTQVDPGPGTPDPWVKEEDESSDEPSFFVKLAVHLKRVEWVKGRIAKVKEVGGQNGVALMMLNWPSVDGKAIPLKDNPVSREHLEAMHKAVAVAEAELNIPFPEEIDPAYVAQEPVRTALERPEPTTPAPLAKAQPDEGGEVPDVDMEVVRTAVKKSYAVDPTREDQVKAWAKEANATGAGFNLGKLTRRRRAIGRIILDTFEMGEQVMRAYAEHTLQTSLKDLSYGAILGALNADHAEQILAMSTVVTPVSFTDDGTMIVLPPINVVDSNIEELSKSAWNVYQ